MGRRSRTSTTSTAFAVNVGTDGESTHVARRQTVRVGPDGATYKEDTVTTKDTKTTTRTAVSPEGGLTDDELDAQSGEELPDREAMSLINANVAAPVNAAVAANVLSDDATAYANATQDADIDQSI